MARIVEYFSRTKAGGSISSPKATGEDFGASIGSALSGAAGAVNDIGDMIGAYQQQKEDLRQAENYSKVLNQLQDLANTQGQRLEDPETDIYSFNSSESELFDSTAQSLVDEAAIDNPELALRLQDNIASIRRGVTSNAFKAETIAIKARRDESINDNISTLTQGVVSGSVGFDQSMQSVENIMSSFRQSFNEVEYNEAMNAYKAQIAETSIESIASVNPQGANNLLQSEKAGEVLSSNQIVRLSKTIEREESRQQVMRLEQDKLLIQRSLVDATREGQFFLDPTSKEHKNAVDADWDVVSRQMSDLEPDQYALNAIKYVGEVGILPTKLESNITAMINNGTPENRAVAADIVIGIAQEKPTALRQFSERERVMAQKIHDGIDAGLSPSKAAEFADKAIILKDSPEYQVRLQSFNSEKKDFNEGDFTEYFRDDPSEVPDGMKAQYNTLFRKYYMDGELDAKSAKNLAVEKVKEFWSPSNVDGSNRWMKYAPESVYNNGTNPKWMQDQFRSDMSNTGIAATDVDTFIDNLLLEVAPESITDDKPFYLVFARDDDNQLTPYLDGNGDHITWRPDYEESEHYKKLLENYKGDVEKIDRLASYKRRVQEIEKNMLSIREGF